MGEIKSAIEIAMEKAEKIGKASKEELIATELEEKGQRTAAKYLSDEDINLLDEIRKYPPKENLHFLKGLVKTFLRNVVLPRDEYALKNAKKALRGLEEAFSAFPEMRQVTAEIERLLEQYLRHRESLYAQLKEQFEAQFSEVEEALSDQMGVRVKVDVESQPQFQEEWKKIRDQLDPQYERQLEYLKALFEKAFP